MIFIHDHTFIKCGNLFYTIGTLDNELMQRYILIFGDVTVLANYREQIRLEGREKPVSNVKLKLVRKSNNPVKFIRNCVKQVKFLKEHHLEPVILRLPSFLGVACGLYLLKHKIPYMVEVVGHTKNILKFHSKLGFIIAPIISKLAKRIIYFADYVLYVTQKYLQMDYPTSGITGGCSDVNINDSSNEIKKNKAKYILGTAGVIDIPYKGQADVIRAMGELKKSGMEFSYYLAGKGDKNKLYQLAKAYGVEQDVVFLGFLDRNGMKHFYNKIDIYIQPSYTEGMPRSVIEAMSYACAVCGSSAGGIPELVMPSYVFRAGNIKQMKEILLSLYEQGIEDLSRYSIEKAKEYNAGFLNDKRNTFYNSFNKFYQGWLNEQNI